MKSRYSVPGKLYIAGEYAVVKGFHAILTPTKLMLHVDIDSHDSYVIESNQWERPKMYDPNSLKNNALWEKALKISYQYLSHKHIEFKSSSITIISDLDKLDHKFGLGSSGAVVIGIIKAILSFHKIKVTPLLLYKLGVLSQKEDVKVSSFGDLACSAFDKPIVYKKDMSLDMNRPFSELIESTWSQLVIQEVSESFDVMVIHTNESSSSSKLVQLLNENMDDKTQKNIFTSIDRHVLSFLNAIRSKNKTTAYKHIRALESLSKTLDDSMNGLMYSKNIQDIFDFAQLHEIAYKISGAGGGDNVILFLDSQEVYNEIKQRLPKPFLNITNYIKGVTYE
jgi:phosphomevalonate kinase